MPKYDVDGTFHVNFSIEVEADSEEDAIWQVNRGDFHPLHDFEWHSEEIEADWADLVEDE